MSLRRFWLALMAVFFLGLSLASEAEAQYFQCGQFGCRIRQFMGGGSACPPWGSTYSTQMGPTVQWPYGAEDSVPSYVPNYSVQPNVQWPYNMGTDMGPVINPSPSYQPNIGAPVAPNPMPQSVDPGFPQSAPPSAAPPVTSSPIPAPVPSAPVAPPVQGPAASAPSVVQSPTTTQPSTTPVATPAREGLGGNTFSRSLAASGASGSRATAKPRTLGDFFGGGISVVDLIDRRTFSGALLGQDVGGQFVLENGGDVPHDDVFTITSSGSDASGDLINDTFNILEPLFPADVLTSPGAGFTFDGGTAVYTNSASGTTAVNGTPLDGDFWFVNYSFSSTTAGNGGQNIIIAGPDVATRRVKISENFSPEIRNRVFINYSHFNNVFGGVGDVDRWVAGFEHRVGPNSSIEVRLPIAATLASTQDINQPQAEDTEIGNLTLIGKLVLAETQNVIFAAGLGVALPLADDSLLTRGDLKVIEVQNNSVHLLPFTGLLVQLTNKTVLQAFLQADLDVNGDKVFGDVNGLASLPQIGTFRDGDAITFDLSLSRLLKDCRNRRDSAFDAIYGTAELHYTASLNAADVVQGNGVTFSSFAPEFDVLNGTLGLQVFTKCGLTLAPAVSVPLRDGTDDQFDYEAMLITNYLF